MLHPDTQLGLLMCLPIGRTLRMHMVVAVGLLVLFSCPQVQARYSSMKSTSTISSYLAVQIQKLAQVHLLSH